MLDYHRSSLLDSFLGHKVRLRLFDNSVYEGILDRQVHSFRYCIINKETGDVLCFCKSHVKEIGLIETI